MRLFVYKSFVIFIAIGFLKLSIYVKRTIKKKLKTIVPKIKINIADNLIGFIYIFIVCTKFINFRITVS